MTMHANSLANLIEPWKKGNGAGSAPIAAGRPPNHGRVLIECINDFSALPKVKLQAIADDDDAPVVRRQAAKSLLRGMHDDFAKSGKPLAMDDLHLHLDYTDGKPVQRVEVARVEIADPAALRVRLMEALAASPGLLASLTAAGVLPAVAQEKTPDADE